MFLKYLFLLSFTVTPALGEGQVVAKSNFVPHITTYLEEGKLEEGFLPDLIQLQNTWKFYKRSQNSTINNPEYLAPAFITLTKPVMTSVEAKKSCTALGEGWRLLSDKEEAETLFMLDPLLSKTSFNVDGIRYYFFWIETLESKILIKDDAAYLTSLNASDSEEEGEKEMDLAEFIKKYKNQYKDKKVGDATLEELSTAVMIKTIEEQNGISPFCLLGDRL